MMQQEQQGDSQDTVFISWNELNAFTPPRGEKQPARPIAIIVAMKSEADPMILRLRMEPVAAETLGFNPKLGLIVFQARVAERSIYLVRNGMDSTHGVDRVSTLPAAITAYETIRVLAPEYIISAGTAGGLKEAKIGDVYLSNSNFVLCDRFIDLPSYCEYALCSSKYFAIPDAAPALGLKLGVVATGSSLDPAPRDLERLKDLDADVVDMEAAAIAEVAERLEIKMIALKAVTNFLDKDLHTAFEHNYATVVSNLAEKLEGFVLFIAGRSS